MGGVAAMKEHIVETVAGELVVSATALLLAYGSKFAWDVVKSDYNDHHELVASCLPSQNALSDMGPSDITSNGYGLRGDRRQSDFPRGNNS